MIKKLLGIVMMLASSLALAAPIAYVHEMTGTGSATTQGQSRPLSVGGLLESGDVISVAKGGSMTVKFEDGQIVALQENSRFAIEKYEYNQKKVSESSSILSLLSGSMRFVTGVIGGTRKEAVALKAGTATIGIRGTDVAINIAGVEYVVVVQNGGVVLVPSAGLAAANIGAGEAAAGRTTAAATVQRAVTLPANLLNAVAPAVNKALPGTQPVSAKAQSALVVAVQEAQRLGDAAAKPNATQAEKDAAAAKAQEVQQAIVAALSATKTAIQAALAGGAPSSTAAGTPATSGTTPGVSAPRATQSEVQQYVNTVNAVLPSSRRLNANQINQIENQLTDTTGGTTQQLNNTQETILKGTLDLINQVLPKTCGGFGQSPC